MSVRIAAVLAAILLAGCTSNASMYAKRLGPGHYRLVADRCMLADRAELEADLVKEAARRCPQGAGPLEEVLSVPSRKGSLLGECRHSGALQAQVRCRSVAP